jgi:hypothetical protein
MSMPSHPQTTQPTQPTLLLRPQIPPIPGSFGEPWGSPVQKTKTKKILFPYWEFTEFPLVMNYQIPIINKICLTRKNCGTNGVTQNSASARKHTKALAQTHSVTKLGFGVVPAWGYFLPFCLNLSRLPPKIVVRLQVVGYSFCGCGLLLGSGLVFTI